MTARAAGPGAPVRVLVLTASMGAGHTEVAAELARRLEARGARVEIVDLLAAAGPAGTRLRATYRTLLRVAPGGYDAVMRSWARHPGPWERLTARGDAPFVAAVRAAVRRTDPHVVVSTYNLAAGCLGRLAGTGDVDAALVTVVIDPGPHPYWVHPRVDLHLAPLPVTAAALARCGAARTAVVAPVLRPEFATPPTRAAARAELGLPDGARVVLVTAGSWAAGRLRRTVAHLAAARDLTVVALCGRDAATARRVAATGARAVGWTDRVVAHLAAADVVVDNAGGLTCWETLAVGTPVVVHDPLPGHGRLNADTLERVGLVAVARDPRELVAAARHLRPGAPPPPAVGPGTADATDLVLAEAARRTAAARRTTAAGR